MRLSFFHRLALHTATRIYAGCNSAPCVVLSFSFDFRVFFQKNAEKANRIAFYFRKKQSCFVCHYWVKSIFSNERENTLRTTCKKAVATVNYGEINYKRVTKGVESFLDAIITVISLPFLIYS